MTQEPDEAQISDIDELELSVRHSYAVQKIALALILDWIDKWPGEMGLTASQRQFEEALVRMNSTGEAAKDQYEKDYDFKRNLNTIRRFNSDKIQLLAKKNGGDAVDEKLNIEFRKNYNIVNNLNGNIKILSKTKEIEIDDVWDDILNSMTDKIDSNRYY